MSGGSSPVTSRSGRERGMVLVTALLLLVVVTLLAVGMFRSFGLDEKIAGNIREKHRALNAAEGAEQYAEWWLAQGNGSTGVPCAALIPATSPPVVCSNPINAINDVTQVPLPFPTGVAYNPPTPTVMNVEGQTVGAAYTEYYSSPTFYIYYVGPAPGGLGTIYQIDAAGYGGSADTAAVVETTYLVQQSVTCTTCGP